MFTITSKPPSFFSDNIENIYRIYRLESLWGRAAPWVFNSGKDAEISGLSRKRPGRRLSINRGRRRTDDGTTGESELVKLLNPADRMACVRQICQVLIMRMRSVRHHHCECELMAGSMSDSWSGHTGLTTYVTSTWSFNAPWRPKQAIGQIFMF